MSDTLAKDGRKNEEDWGERNEFFMHRSFPCRLSETPAASPSFFGVLFPFLPERMPGLKMGKRGALASSILWPRFMASNIASGVVFYGGNCHRGNVMW